MSRYFFHTRIFFFCPSRARFWEGRKGQEERDQEMEVTSVDNVEPPDPHEWSSENVSTFVRSLGTSECFQSVGDQVM
jgi:hypothetical protein